jgi:hypothetical protein
MFLSDQHGRYDECLQAIEAGLELARRRGDRGWEWNFLAARAELKLNSGDWAEAEACVDAIPVEAREAGGFLQFVLSSTLVFLNLARGNLAEARRVVEALPSEYEDAEAAASARLGWAGVLLAEGQAQEALAAAARSAEGNLGDGNVGTGALGLSAAVAAALALEDVSSIHPLLDRFRELSPAERSPVVDAHIARAGALVAAHEGDQATGRAGLRVATATFREFALPFWLAVTQLEHGELLVRLGRSGEAEPFLAEARAIFERLRAQPWLERLARAEAGTAVPA